MPDDPTEALDELWTDYKSNGTANARERLILHYSPLVKFVAGRVAAGLPQNIEQSDLVSYGIFGLIDAIDKFDPGRGFKFETYAISRIKGAIIDELRSIDWVPRSVRAKARAIERAISKLENELRRTPEDGEVAAELDGDLVVLGRAAELVLELRVGALDRAGLRPHRARHPVDRAQLVDDGALDAADRVRLELEAAGRVELVDRVDQPEDPVAHEVRLLDALREPLGDAAGDELDER